MAVSEAKTTLLCSLRPRVYITANQLNKTARNKNTFDRTFPVRFGIVIPCMVISLDV